MIKARQLALIVGKNCRYCEVETTYGRVHQHARPPANHGTVDHITPKHLGGTNDISNLAIACYGCNTHKMHKSEEEFLQSKYLEARKQQVKAKCLETVVLTHLPNFILYPLVSPFATNEEKGNWNENAGSNPVEWSRM